jgi:hypothetical protein
LIVRWLRAAAKAASFRAQHLREVNASGTKSRAHADRDGEQQDESRNGARGGRIQWLNSKEKRADDVGSEI